MKSHLKRSFRMKNLAQEINDFSTTSNSLMKATERIPVGCTPSAPYCGGMYIL